MQYFVSFFFSFIYLLRQNIKFNDIFEGISIKYPTKNSTFRNNVNEINTKPVFNNTGKIICWKIEQTE